MISRAGSLQGVTIQSLQNDGLTAHQEQLRVAFSAGRPPAGGSFPQSARMEWGSVRSSKHDRSSTQPGSHRTPAPVTTVDRSSEWGSTSSVHLLVSTPRGQEKLRNPSIFFRTSYATNRARNRTTYATPNRTPYATFRSRGVAMRRSQTGAFAIPNALYKLYTFSNLFTQNGDGNRRACFLTFISF